VGERLTPFRCGHTAEGRSPLFMWGTASGRPSLRSLQDFDCFFINPLRFGPRLVQSAARPPVTPPLIRSRIDFPQRVGFPKRFAGLLHPDPDDLVRDELVVWIELGIDGRSGRSFQLLIPILVPLELSLQGQGCVHVKIRRKRSRGCSA